jgi:hypothetical protein
MFNRKFDPNILNVGSLITDAAIAPATRRKYLKGDSTIETAIWCKFPPM